MENKIKLIESELEEIIKRTNFNGFSKQERLIIKTYINEILLDVKISKHLDQLLVKKVKEKLNESRI